MNNDVLRVLMIGMHDKIGGIETFIMNYFRNIDRNKIVFDFVNMYDELAFSDEIEDLGGKIYKVPNVKKNPIGYYRRLKNIMQDNHYKVVHINLMSAANVLPVSIAKKCNIQKIIVHSHNTDTPKGVLRKILNSINKKTVLKKANVFLACSNIAGKWLYEGKRDFKVINNAIDIESFRFEEKIRKELREKIGVQDELVIGHVGRFEEQKNHEFLIKIFYETLKIRPDARLLLIGERCFKARYN